MYTEHNPLVPIYAAIYSWIFIILNTSIYEKIISKFDNRIHRRILRVIIYSFSPMFINILLEKILLDSYGSQMNRSSFIGMTKQRITDKFVNLNLVNKFIKNALTETAGEILFQELEKAPTESKENISLAN